MKIIRKKSVVELPKATGSISDTLNVEDKITNAPSINLVQQMAGVPTDGVIEFRGEEIPEGYEEVEAPSGGIDITAIVDLLYPVGRGFLDFTDTDYSNWLGLTWERELVGMFPVGYNPNDTSFDSIGEKGGEKTHTLTLNEMPTHSHNGMMWGENSGMYFGVNSNSNGLGTWKMEYTSAKSEANFYTSRNGGSQPHNNLPPYQVVSYWKRVDPNAKTMISFTMWGITYQAEEGMTFAEWVPSEYNTDGWYYPSENSLALINPRGNIIDYADISASAKPTDIIENGKTYSTYTEK